MTTIRVGARHEEFTPVAEVFDGITAERQRCVLEIVEGAAPALLWRRANGTDLRLPLEELREIPDQADRGGSLILTSIAHPLMRIVIENAGDARIMRRRAPHLSRAQPVRGRGRIMGWAIAAVASVLVIVFGLVPVMADRLAGLLPPEGEVALGDVAYDQIQTALGADALGDVSECTEPAGQAALDTLVTRFGADGLRYPLRLSVLDHSMKNAFALPGGRVILFRGLIELADGPDEVAAVLAHEIGHVAARDPTRIALRSAGSVGVLGLLLGDFAGGAAVLFLTNQLIQADYTRTAEKAADDFALDLMGRARVDAAALGSLFEKLQAEGGDPQGLGRHFASHPALGDRIARARAVAVDDPRPALDDAQWAALRAICDED